MPAPPCLQPPCPVPPAVRRPARIRHLLAAWLTALACLAAGPAAARDHNVADTAGILDALRVAAGGDTIRLAPGDYAPLQLAPRARVPIRFDPPVTLTSADPARPAVLTGLQVAEAQGLTFTGLVFDYRFAPGDALSKRPFAVNGSERITFRGNRFDGDLAQGRSEADDGYATAFGLGIRGSKGIVVEGNRIARFYRGLTCGWCSDVVVRGNEITELRMDGMNFSQGRNILIEDNWFHSFRRSPHKGDHADMIQFWTNGTKEPTRNVTIRRNVIMTGEGGQTQSIFMRNDMVDRGLAGYELFYRNIAIEENVIINGHTNGIILGAADGVVIRANTLLRNPRAAEGAARERMARIPRIQLSEEAVNVRVEGNIAVSHPRPQPGWVMRDNLAVQDISPLRPGYYHQLFTAALTGDPGDLDSFAVRPGTPADALGLGAPLLRPGADRSRFRLPGDGGR